MLMDQGVQEGVTCAVLRVYTIQQYDRFYIDQDILIGPTAFSAGLPLLSRWRLSPYSLVLRFTWIIRIICAYDYRGPCINQG